MNPLRRSRSERRWELYIANRLIVGSGLPREFWRDVFHYCMTLSWPRVFGGFLGVYLVVNLVFSLLYWLVDGAVVGVHAPRYSDLLFFSFRVFGTASFGGFLPGNLYGEVVATTEIVIGIISYAMMTGLAVARFTRPQAQVLFARHPVIRDQDGQRMLAVRIANTRHNFMSDTHAKMWLIAADEPPPGASVSPTRRFHRLPLVRDDNPIFALSWTLFHVIDPSSPLHGLNATDLARRTALIAVIVNGHDEDYAQDVRARHLYENAEIRWDHDFVNIFGDSGGDVVHVDYSRFHDTLPVAAGD